MKKIVCFFALLLLLGIGVMAQEAVKADGAAPKAAVTEAPATTSASVAAVPAGAAEETATPEYSITMKDIMLKGGWLMYVIALLSIVAIALVIFYFLTMRQGVLYPKSFLLEAQECAENGNLEALQDLCSENSSSAAKVIQASLEEVIPNQPLDYDRIREAMEDEGGRQAGILWQRLQYLMDIAVISPMVGLLGTVWGMMISFGGIGGVDFVHKAETMADGIAQAMYTTFGGLIVGIFAMALYDVIRGRLNKLISGMESACGGVLRRLAPAGSNGKKFTYCRKAPGMDD